jgi:hypothetical protein
VDHSGQLTDRVSVEGRQGVDVEEVSFAPQLLQRGSASDPARWRDSLCIVKFARQMCINRYRKVWSITVAGRPNCPATLRALVNMASMTTRSGASIDTTSTSSSPTAGELV